MNEQDKKLLVRELCARMPYGVKCEYKGDVLHCIEAINIDNDEVFGIWNGYEDAWELELCKPYLRPFSSITHEEILDAVKRCMGGVVHERGGRYYSSHYDPIYDEVESDFDLEYFKEGYYGIPNIDWLNEHHFDYNNLIGKGLAVEAPQGMYNFDK